jgi:hypothetical protein
MCRRGSKEIGEWAFSADELLGIRLCYKFE